MENSEMTYEQIIEEICNRTTIDDDFAVTVVTTNDHDRYELRINVDFLEDGSDHNGLSSNPSRSDSLFDQATELDKRQSFTAM